MLADGGWDLIQRLTLILLTWTIWRAPTNASKWRMGFNSAFKGLMSVCPSFYMEQLCCLLEGLSDILNWARYCACKETTCFLNIYGIKNQSLYMKNPPTFLDAGYNCCLYYKAYQ